MGGLKSTMENKPRKSKDTGLQGCSSRGGNDMVLKLTRKQYTDLFGPSKGDKIRLGDTDIIIEVEKSASPGDECVFGGGKTIRDGLAQASGVTNANGALDYVITNAVVLDPIVGIVKGDIGIKDGKIAGIGKAGNPLTMDKCLQT